MRSRSSRYETYAEMDTMEFIHRGLELIADDASQPNDDGDTTKVYSDNEEIKEVIHNLFINKLDMNNELWSIIYETIKNGDNFYEVIPDDYKKPKEIKEIRSELDSVVAENKLLRERMDIIEKKQIAKTRKKKG